MILDLLPQPRSIRPANGAGIDATATPAPFVVDSDIPLQGYRLTIKNGLASIVAADDAGAFYARQTLDQLRGICPAGLPSIVIEDWPDFLVRGFMLDISRCKVPTMQSLFDLVDLLSSLKINQLQLYTEHTFAYRDHEVVWKDASPMMAEEIRQLDRYCKDRFIELVPNQQSFGHLERWFKHPRYHRLAEKPDGFAFPTGKRMPHGFSLNPLDPASLHFVESLYDELLPNFTSSLFNIGCDETFDLGLGRSHQEVQRRGRETVYLDFLMKIHHAVKERGRTMMFWGDIILEKPELLAGLPPDIIALNWGYEADHPFEKETSAFKAAGIPFYVCPGTSSWCSISGRTDNALANLKSAAIHGLRQGASGYLITDWGDYGHLQYWPISYLGLAAGAAYSWCLESNGAIDLARALDVHILHDSAGVMGQVLHDFGNVYQAAREPLVNGSRFFWALINDPDRQKLFNDLTPTEYRNAELRIDSALAPLADARMSRLDAQLILDELRNAAQMLRLACAFTSTASRNEVIQEHRRLWLQRNRPGGLDESVSMIRGRR